MTLVTITDEDNALRKKIIEDSVLRQWVARAGKDAAKEWNTTVGPAVGMKAPID